MKARVWNRRVWTKGWLIVVYNAALATIQLVWFAPLVAEGRSVDWPGDAAVPLYRVDGLGLVFGVAWCVALGLIWAVGMRPERGALWAAYLTTPALLQMAYAREPWMFYIGWEVFGASLWLALRAVSREQASGRFALLLNASGWPLLVMILLGLTPAFAPPVGGVASEWPLPLAGALGLSAFIRGGCRPFDGWIKRFGQGQVAPLFGLYMASAPFVMAKALVAAPWGPLGTWALTLLGVIGFLGGIRSSHSGGRAAVSGIVSIWAAASIIGLGLAARSPLAAAGGVALMLTGIVGVAPSFGERNRGIAPFLLAATVPGVWLLAQGSLDAGYGLIAAIALPGMAFAIFQKAGNGSAPGGYRLPIILYCLLLAAYPQIIVALALGPAIQAMAGGVGALTSLVSDWGAGLSVNSQGEATLASLPASGMAAAVLLALITLYWLRRLSARVIRNSSDNSDHNGQSE